MINRRELKGERSPDDNDQVKYLPLPPLSPTPASTLTHSSLHSHPLQPPLSPTPASTLTHSSLHSHPLQPPLSPTPASTLTHSSLHSHPLQPPLSPTPASTLTHSSLHSYPLRGPCPCPKSCLDECDAPNSRTTVLLSNDSARIPNGLHRHSGTLFMINV